VDVSAADEAHVAVLAGTYVARNAARRAVASGARARARGRYAATAVGEVVRFAEVVRMRRQRENRRRHARCVSIISASVSAARVAVATAPAAERWVWMSRLRKLEELEAWASGGVA
jgi:hypothetical protein